MCGKLKMAFPNNQITGGVREQYKARRTTQSRILSEDIDYDRLSSFSSISSSFDERLSDADFVRSFVPPPVISPPPSPPPPPPPSYPPPSMNLNNGIRRPSRIPPPPPKRTNNNPNNLKNQNHSLKKNNNNNHNNENNDNDQESSEPPSQQDILHQSVLSAISGGIKLRHRSLNKEENKNNPTSPTSMQTIFEKQIMGTTITKYLLFLPLQ